MVFVDDTVVEANPTFVGESGQSADEKERTMAAINRVSAREAKRLQTRERLLGAAIAEFKRSGMAEADVSAIVAAAGVAHGTFFLPFSHRARAVGAGTTGGGAHCKPVRPVRAIATRPCSALQEAVRLVLALERRLGASLFKDFLALHLSQTRRPAEEGRDHPIIVLVAKEIERAQGEGLLDPDVNPMNSAVFFLLGLYALLTTTHDWPTQGAMLEDYVTRTLRSLAPMG
jgi:AcrR family transcriptional regulator